MTADLLVRGARVVPLSSFAPPTPVDVLVRDGRVAEVAPGLDARDVPVVEADGRWWLAPGLWDHHVHMTQWARTVDRLDLSGTRSAAEAVGRVAERSRHSPTRW